MDDPGWGLPLEVRTDRVLGHSVAVTGIFDIAVTESATAPSRPGEAALDVGANFGYMTSVLVSATGRSGRTVAYEPDRESSSNSSETFEGGPGWDVRIHCRQSPSDPAPRCWQSAQQYHGLAHLGRANLGEDVPADLGGLS